MSQSPHPLPSGVLPGPLAAYNGYVYTIGNNGNLYKLSTTVGIEDGTATPFLGVSSISGPQFITISSSGKMYISAVGDNNPGNGAIYLIDNLNTPVLTTFVSGIDSPRGLQVVGSYLYVITVTIGEVTNVTKFNRILLSNPATRTSTSFADNTFTAAQQMAYDNDGFFYIIAESIYTNCYIARVQSGSLSINATWANLNSTVGASGSLGKALVYDSVTGFLYFSFYDNGGDGNKIGRLNLAGTVTNSNYFPTLNISNTSNFSVAVLNGNFYIDFYISESSNYSYTIYGLPIYASSVTCFGENTKILCFDTSKMEEEYISIENIRSGTLVSTSMNGYVRVDMIGKSTIRNYANNERIKNRLYKCTKDNYPEIVGEDLIVTGCHSILVDYLNDEQQEKTIQEINQLYVTDKKYRLFTFLDPRAEPYQVDGELPIYHIALENENYYMNYGIYANGLLVESCSKRYLKELSGMTLIE